MENDYLLRLHDDPVFFAKEVFGLTPTDQQTQFLNALAKPGAHVSVRSGHGTGKSTAMAIAALWFICTREDAKVPCTAPTGHQLEDVLWAEMRRLYNTMSEYMQSQIKFGADRISKANNPASFIVARTARKENPDALQGFHAPEILFLIDEAAGVHESVFEVARGALSTPSARVALAANPTKLTGYFYNTHKLHRDTWTQIQFSCLDSPLVDPSYAEDIESEYGKDSDMYRVRVLGDFPKHGLYAMISMEDVQQALNRVIPLGALDYAPVKLGVDPAWEGTDRSVIVYRRGIHAKVLMVERGLNGHELGSRVIYWQDKLDAHNTYVDKTGVGASCYDYLRANNRRCVGVSFAGTPNEDRFINKRAEIWWKMREWFQESVAIDHHADIVDDLTGPEYGIKDNGKVYLESKQDMRKRGLASPDIGDALALTFTEPDRSLQSHGGGGVVRKNKAMERYNPYDTI